MRVVQLIIAASLAVAGVVPVTGAAAQAADCPDTGALDLPEAGWFEAVCLDDLTTLSNDRTDTGASTGAGTRENGSLHSDYTEHPEQPVPGIQIDGWYSADSCDRYTAESNRFVESCPDGRRHNGQFVVRIPNDWDGVHLIVGGTPGIRTQYSSDIILSDRVLSRGWAYASQDKGNIGVNFFRAGDDETGGSLTQWEPNAAIEQWSTYVAAAAETAQRALEQLHDRRADLTYAAGISNGGYQTRLAVERHPELFDGGIDWEGTLYRPEGPNLHTYLPPILRNYPAYEGGSDEAYDALVHEGRLPPDSEPVWDYHYTIYWGLTQSIYRPVIDPEYTNYVAVPRTVVPPGDPDAEYDYHARPDFVKERAAALSPTGELHGKPFITLHGTLDALLPIDTDSDVYARLAREKGQADNFRYYVVEGGTHVDTLADDHQDVMRPILPCFLGAIDELDQWVTGDDEPPPSGFIPYDGAETEEEYERAANECALPGSVERFAGADRIETAIRASRATYGITETVVIASADSYPDALAAAPLAGRVGGPILLVRDELDDRLRDELHRLGALHALVVGGPEAVSDEVVAQLEAADLTVQRVAGDDRFATAAAVAEAISSDSGEAIVVSGRSFADALSAGPLAAAGVVPVLLTEPHGLPDATAAALRTLGIERTLVVGGPRVVPDSVEDRLPSPTRIAGPDRYATSAAVAQFALDRGHTFTNVHLATGTDFADALSAGPITGRGEWGTAGRGMLLLVHGEDAGRSAATLDLLEERRSEIERIVLFGGPAAISSDVEGAVRTATER